MEWEGKEKGKGEGEGLTCLPGWWFRGMARQVEIHLDKESQGNDPYRAEWKDNWNRDFVTAT